MGLAVTEVTAPVMVRAIMIIRIMGLAQSPYQTCVWSGYEWKCYNFNGYFDSNYY